MKFSLLKIIESYLYFRVLLKLLERKNTVKNICVILINLFFIFNKNKLLNLNLVYFLNHSLIKV